MNVCLCVKCRKHVIQVREYNQSAPERAQLAGQKGQAVKNLLKSLPSETQELLINVTVQLGFDKSPWSDDALASRKWLPGYQPLGAAASSL